MSCEDCQSDPDLKEDRGCGTPAQNAVWDSFDGDVFYSCPLRYITQEMAIWYEEYSYCEEFGSTVDYDACSSKFIEAWLYYKSQMNRYAMMQQDKMKSKSMDGLSVLKQSYLQRGEHGSNE